MSKDMLMERKFNVSSMGELFNKSVENIADKITDKDGNEISLESISVGQKVFLVFRNGTGFTRTSAERIK